MIERRFPSWRRASLMPLLGAALALAMVAGPARAAGTVAVQWIEPQRFTDAGNDAFDRERVLRTLERHIAAWGERLPDGQVLKIAVTDVNLAGEVDHRGLREVRVLQGGADAPRIALRWTLGAGDATLAAGEDTLRDLDYLFRTRDDELGYEKRMLDRWFDERILKR